MPGNFEDHKRGFEMPIESHRCLCQYGRANGASWARFGVGGAGYSIFPRHALTYLAADMGIQGEGVLGVLAMIHSHETTAKRPKTPKGLNLQGRTNIEEMIRGVEKIKMKEIKAEQAVPPDADDP
jgi:hypothetical protein